MPAMNELCEPPGSGGVAGALELAESARVPQLFTNALDRYTLVRLENQ